MGTCMGPACNSFAFSFANSNDLPLPGEYMEDGYRTTIHPVFPGYSLISLLFPEKRSLDAIGGKIQSLNLNVVV